MDIRVICEACGTELETPDASCDALLRVTIIARPCPKCNRPPDCHLSCEDVLRLKKERKEMIIQSLPPDIRECFGTSNNSNRCPNCSYLASCGIVEEENEKSKEIVKPGCFGNYDTRKNSECITCSWAQACRIKADRDMDDDDDETPPSCFGNYNKYEADHDCSKCNHRVGCMNETRPECFGPDSQGECDHDSSTPCKYKKACDEAKRPKCFGSNKTFSRCSLCVTFRDECFKVSL